MKDFTRPGYQLKMITDPDIAAIHRASLTVLAETGAYYEDPEVVDLLVAAGAKLTPEGGVLLSPEMVEKAIASAPKKLSLYSRLGVETLHLEPGYVYFGTGSDCPFVTDWETGLRRQAHRKDIEAFARLGDALPNIDFILSMGIASDVPVKTADQEHFLAMVENTTKPLFFTVVDSSNMQPIVEMAEAIAGSKSALRDRPFAAHFAMPSPPLRHSKTALQNLIACARQHIPVVYASGTQLGTSGPMSIVGGTVSSNCDVLSGLVVHQLVNPGAPFIYGVCVAPIDMHTVIECYGAPEHFSGDLLNVQVAQQYGLPTWGYAGDTDSKLLDLQAALEYTASITLGLESGCNLLHDVGYLESGMVASYDGLVFGDAVIESVRRIFPKVQVNEESLALATIQHAGRGGSFLLERHTLRHFREFLYSPLIDRRRHEDWQQSGSLSMEQRIHARTCELLDPASKRRHEPAPLDASLRNFLHEFIKRQLR